MMRIARVSLFVALCAAGALAGPVASQQAAPAAATSSEGAGPDTGTPAAASASGPQPIVEVDLSATEVVPGQPVVMRVTVLVPTWLPKPIAFPAYEAPDLMVKLLEKNTTPVSRSVDGVTWSGVSRAYRLSPMVPGPVDIPTRTIDVGWAEPGRTEPNVAQIPIEGARLTGIVPEGAEALDPFIAAEALSLTQDVSDGLAAEARSLRPGDSLTRRVTAEVSGTSPLFVPSLLPPVAIPGIATYPDEPRVTETADRAWVSGSRVESTTLVAESGGSGQVPPVTLDWFNLGTGQVETARLEGFDVRVDGPVARDLPALDWQKMGLLALVGVIALFSALRLWRGVRPRLTEWRVARRRAREASEPWAYARLREAVSAKDYPAMLRALALWAARQPGAAENPVLQQALIDLGATLYGSSRAEARPAWDALVRALDQTRAQASPRSAPQGMPHLAALNPR